MSSSNRNEVDSRTGIEIAVIGMAGRFPGAGNIHDFWENLKNGVESVSFLSTEEIEELDVQRSFVENSNYVNAKGGILGDKEYFDASFFGYAPNEAELMDPQIRLFHECCWEALENAAYDPGSYNGMIGLYAGAAANFNWKARAHLSGKSSEMGLFAAHLLTEKDLLCTTISYKLDLKGAAVLVQTACSTSLVAIHLACQAIINGECDMALAGGVNVLSEDPVGYIYQDGMINSPDGRCRAFDAGAKGTISGEGAGVVVLKLLEDALEDNDHICAVVKGSAINNDGIRRSAYTAPGRVGQTEVIVAARHAAEVEPESIVYIETHGTGTSLGDPIEVEALARAYNTTRKNVCAVGSVKCNIGHLGSAAGVAGFIKAVLILEHKHIPPSINFEIPNPQIDFINSPFYVNSTSGKLGKGDYPLRTAVSSLGIGGTNAHVILEERPEEGEPGAGNGEYQLIVLSAKTPTALENMKKNLAGYLTGKPGLNIADAAYTLQVGRRAFPHRWMAVCLTAAETIEALTSPGVGETNTVLPGEDGPYPGEIVPAADRHSLTQIGRSWLRGERIDWDALYPEKGRPRVPLPAYPFERQWYWLEGNIITKSAAGAGAKENTLSNRGIDANMTDWFYLPTWKRTPRKPRSRKKQTGQFSWLVFAGEISIAGLLVEQFKERSEKVVIVRMGDKFSREENSIYTVDPRESSHYDSLFTQLRINEELPDKIIHLWNITGENNLELNPGRFDGAQYPGFYSLLYTANAVVRQGIDREMQIVLLTDHLLDVLGEERLCPEKAPVLGLLKVIPQEHPGISCRHIDILLPEQGASTEAVFVTRLMDEFTDVPGDPVIAYRNNQRWVQVLDPVPLEESEEQRAGLRKNGVYLVTGGLGKLGLNLAELLARRGGGGTRLVLTGRSGFPAREEWPQWLSRHGETDPVSMKIGKLQKLEEMGAGVFYFQADCAEKDRMQKVVTRVEKQFGGINGVIHAAGTAVEASLQPIREISPENCRMLFQAKVYGLMVLEELLRGKSLDFSWVISSLSSILGGLNLGAFSAAGSFADVFVKRHNRLEGPRSSWLSLNWEQMEPGVSAAAFERLFFLEDVDQIAVSVGGNLQGRIDGWVKLKPVRNGNNDVSSSEKKSRTNPRPALPTPYAAPENPQEETLAAIWKSLFGYDEIGIHDDFFLLGGDSLRIITVVSKIQKKMKILIPIPEFFNHPTIKELAEYISEKPAEEIHIPIEPAEKKEYYSLTSAQKRMYIIQQMDETNTGYNIFTSILLEGKELRRRIEEIFRTLIARHESLRTSFELIDNEPVQRVWERVDFSIDFHDLSDKPGESPVEPGSVIPVEDQIERTVKKCIRPFDLSSPPLVRAGLIKTHASTYVLVGDMHHIISDGYSMGILVKEFVSLYAGEELSPLKIHYTDYSEWLKRGNIQPSLSQQEEYWLKEFAGDIPELQLPTDYERPAVQSFDGNMVDFILDENVTAGLQAVISKSNATLFMVLVAVYNVLLAKLSGQEDLVVGIGIVGRRYEELQKVIGMFVNTLCIRNYPVGRKTFNGFLREVKEKTLLAYQNQDYQFEELVEKVSPKRKKNRNPLFDTAIVSQDIALEAADILPANADVLKAKPYSLKSDVSKFDITLIYEDIGNKIRLTFEYCTKLFKQDTVLRFTDYFKEIASGVSVDPDARLDDITISHHLLEASTEEDEDQMEVDL